LIDRTGCAEIDQQFSYRIDAFAGHARNGAQAVSLYETSEGE
jgi:hypothetical protein